MVSEDVTKSGSHHLGMHPDKRHVYAGSNEGNVFVIDRFSMKTINIVEAGALAGHTTFNESSGIAVQTNHRDSFMTLIDMKTHTFIKNVSVARSFSPIGSLAQSHTTSFDPKKSGVFYTAASDDGNYVEVDAESGVVTRTLPLDADGYIIQGTYNWNLQ